MNRDHLNAAPAETDYQSSSSMAARMSSSDDLSVYHSLTAASPDPLNMTPSSQLEFQFQPNDPIRTFSPSQIVSGLHNAGAFAQGTNMNSAEGYSPGESAHLPHYILSPIDQDLSSSVPMFADVAWHPDESLEKRYQQPYTPVTAPISTETPQRVLHFLQPGQITLSRRQSAPACPLPLMPGENPPFRLDGPPPLLPSHLSVAVTSPLPASPDYTGHPPLSISAEPPQMTFQRVGDKRKRVMQIAESNIVRHNSCFTSGPETRSYGGEGGWLSIKYPNPGFGV